MPQIVAGAGIAGGVAALFGGSFMQVFATTIAAGFLGQLLSPMASGMNNGLPRSRQVSTQHTMASRRYVLGRAQIAAATNAYAQNTGDDNEYFHLVLPLCQGPITAVDDILLDNVAIGSRDADGVVIDGVFEKQPDGAGGYAELVRAQVDLGESTKTANADLVSESGGKWTTNHRGRGIADITLRLRRDANDKVFPNGIPQLRAVVRGVKCYDPRDGGTRYTSNPALLVRWLLTLDRPDGFGIADAEINDTLFAAAASICDERVSVDTYTSPAVTASASTNTLTFATRDITIGHGDGVQVASTGSVPGGLSTSTTYYAIRPDGLRCQLATSYANALAGTAIDLTDAGSGTITLSHVDQARYTCNGVYDTSQSPRQVLTAILATMAGVVWYAEGVFQIRAGAWVTPRSAPITAADLAGPVRLQSGTAWRDLFNIVRGSYTDPLQDYQPTDFAAVSDATAITADGAELATDLDMQFVDSPIRAQRIAQINLRRVRSGQQLTLLCKLTVLDVALWSTVKVTLDHLGLDEATYRVVGWNMVSDGATLIELTLQAETSSVFGWSATDASAVTARPALSVPNPRAVVPPPSSAMESGTAHLLALADGTVISRILFSWGRPAEPNLAGYDVRYKRSTDTDYAIVSGIDASATSLHISPVEDGATYNVHVRSRNKLGGASDWVENAHVVVGKTAAPTAPTSLSATSSPRALLWQWTLCPDADYGTTELVVSATNNRGAGATHTIKGDSHTVTGLTPSATYYAWVRHVDSSGNVSAWYPTSSTAGVSAAVPADDTQQITHGTSSYMRGGATGYMTGAGYWAGYDSGSAAYVWRLGDPSGKHVRWNGTDLIIDGGLLAGDVQVSSTGNVRGGQTGYDTGSGFFLGYSGGLYKLSIGSSGGSKLTWDGTTLNVSAQVQDTRAFAAGTNIVAASWAAHAMPLPATTYTKLKSIKVPRAGTLRASWTVAAGTTGSNTKTRIYVNGSAVGVEKTTTTMTPTTYTDDITVASGDTVELWGWWNSASGFVYDYTLGNSFNENYFIVLQD